MVATVLAIASAFGFWLALYLLRWMVMGVASLVASLLIFPAEAWLLQRLQDRAMARSLGIDAAVIRFRRRIDFPTH
jgi:hypothetical protein